jgi:predicted aspartyl protease
LSEAAVVGKESSRSMRLLGQMQGHEVSILVDSGSSHTFLSATLAADMSGVSQLTSALAVKLANGNSLVCSLQLQHAKWEV